MGRGSKFAFPLPGRKTNVSLDRPHDDPNYHNLAVPVDQWSPRTAEPSSFSKAERLLGTSSFPFRPSSRNQSPGPPTSPAYMTVSVSEASFETTYTGNMSSPGFSEANLYPHQRPGLSKRPSSNVLGGGFQDAVRSGSQSSSVSHRLLPQTSNSTLRSYYDPQKSPLSVSQQTSASAVRDMGLRKGKPIVVHDPDHTLRPSSRQAADDLMKKQYRKSKPTRLDLSKLFPKPRSNGVEHAVPPLLSPNKLVNSPSALSSTSEYFPRPMTREPTPTPNLGPTTKPRAKLIKSPKLHQDPSLYSAPRPSSPTRLHERDTYDNAKIHVRRPPRGIQHWFDALGESDEDEEEEEQPPAPHPSYPNGPHSGLTKKSSAPHLASHATGPATETHPSTRRGDAFKHDVYGQSSIYPSHSLHSPNHFLTRSQTSLGTCKTKESAFSRSNLQDSSVLSFSSSSEDEEDEAHRKVSNPFKMRDSIESTDYQGEIIIGKAQAYDIRPFSPGRRTSESKMSMRTTSTSAATIEVMYTPEPYYPQTFPRPYGSRRSSHVRQPSIIPEDAGEDVRPKTSAQRSMSPSASVRSGRTSVSEPRRNGHKLMAVTEEEEALLEMMRRKRAAMAKHSFAEGYKTALSQESRQKTPPETKSHRTSAFLSNETPAGSPARAPKPASRNSVTSSPLLHPPPRGRPGRSTQDLHAGASVLQDNSSCDDASSRRHTPSPLAINRHQLSPPPEFSPLDIFPSPAATPTEASIASPTTTDHPSPIPSPITPGLRQGETEVDVKVASSEPSCNGDNEEVPVLETGVIHPPSGSLKPSENGSHAPTRPHHLRRRTASSDANVTLSPVLRAFPKADGQISGVAMESHDLALAPVSEASSRPPSIVVDPQLPRKSSRRFNSVLKVNTVSSVSRNSSLYSARTSSPARGATERRTSKAASRGSSISSGKRDSFAVGSSTRCSVSEDVLAAWGSLGGWRDFDSGRAM